jgi:hypothetical protein
MADKPFEYENMQDDFKMPYKNYGILDYENLKQRYMKLTNAPRQLLQQRYTINQW